MTLWGHSSFLRLLFLAQIVVPTTCHLYTLTSMEKGNEVHERRLRGNAVYSGMDEDTHGHNRHVRFTSINVGDGKKELERQRQDCVLPSSGSYGELQSQTSYPVSFHYQAVFVSETSDFEISDDLLPLLERSITEGILPELFECPGIIRKGPVSGISMAFPDRSTGSGK